jgi:sulfite reductase (ferredoxin)
VILCDLPPHAQSEVEGALRDAGAPLAEDLSPLRRNFLACPALPTCGLALAEAERMTPGLLARLEAELKRRGLPEEPITLRISGCPSGCARSATADLALVGRAAGRYAIYAGGRMLGDRLNALHRDDVPEEQLVEELIAALVRMRAGHVGAVPITPAGPRAAEPPYSSEA